jgi:Homeodomain-like domain
VASRTVGKTPTPANGKVATPAPYNRVSGWSTLCAQWRGLTPVWGRIPANSPGNRFAGGVPSVLEHPSKCSKCAERVSWLYAYSMTNGMDPSSRPRRTGDEELAQNQEIIRQHLAGGRSVRKIAKAVGLPSTSVYRVIQNYRAAQAGADDPDLDA